MLFPILGPSSLPVVVAQLTKDMQTEQLLCCSGMTDTEHTTSGLNDEAKIICCMSCLVDLREAILRLLNFQKQMHSFVEREVCGSIRG